MEDLSLKTFFALELKKDLMRTLDKILLNNHIPKNNHHH